MSLRNSIFWAHLVVGVAVGLVVLVLSVTGALMAFRPQILEVTEQQVRHVVPPEGAAQLRLSALLDKAAAAFPDSRARGVTLSSDPSASVAINLGRDAGTLYVNPYTGDILGKGSWMAGFMEDVEAWHRWLAMTGPWKQVGHNLKSACTIAFFLLILSGIYLWWPRKYKGKPNKPLLAVRPGLKGKAKDWNLHNVIGFWSAPFLAVIALTGIVMAYSWANTLLFRLTGNEPPAAMDRPAEGKAGGKKERGDDPKMDADQVAARAAAQDPQWRTMNIRLSGGGPVQVFIERKGQVYPKRSQLTLDGRTGAVISWEPYDQQNNGRKLRTFVRFLHTGEALGPVGQVVAFAASCAALMLVWTGLSLTWRRFFGAARA